MLRGDVAKVLVVGGEAATRSALAELAARRGLELLTAPSTEAGLAELEAIDLVVSALSTLEAAETLLDGVRAHDENIPVIVLGAAGSSHRAAQALDRGALDYIELPFEHSLLSHRVVRALELRSLRRAAARLSLEEAAGVRVVGESLALERALRVTARLAKSELSVLIRGEPGTGKQVFANLFHARSSRSARPLVKFNCAAVPHELAEAQLFGYAQGAFTGAQHARSGYIAQARGGTLLLDEVAELTLHVQAKLLRVLQEREVQPLGSNRVEQVDFRLLVSTHRDLASEVRDGRFRADLYERIAEAELLLPSLRERREDIRLLAAEFARKYGERFGVDGGMQLTPELVALLEGASWPGNVKQLEHAIARGVALSTGNILGPAAFELSQNPAVSASLRRGPSGSPPEGPSFREQLEAFERNLLFNSLTATQYNQSETARRLGLNRATLYDRLKKYSLLPEPSR
jgi:two-component system response regulator AtoC